MTLKVLEERAVIAMLGLLIVLVFLAASLRWFGVSIAWSIDIAQLLFSWVCFVGADLALRADSHVGVDMLTRRLPPSVRITIALLLNLMILGFVVSIFFYGTMLCTQNYRRTFNTVPISYSFVTLSAPVGSFLMTLTLVARIKNYIKNIIKREYSSLLQDDVIEDTV